MARCVCTTIGNAARAYKADRKPWPSSTPASAPSRRPNGTSSERIGPRTILPSPLLLSAGKPSTRRPTRSAAQPTICSSRDRCRRRRGTGQLAHHLYCPPPTQHGVAGKKGGAVRRGACRAPRLPVRPRTGPGLAILILWNSLSSIQTRPPAMGI